MGKYRLDLHDYELKSFDGSTELTGVNNSHLRLHSQSVTHIEPLPFGGFLAFEPDHVHFYADLPMSLMRSANLHKELTIMGDLLVKSSKTSHNSIVSAVLCLDNFE